MKTLLLILAVLIIGCKKKSVNPVVNDPNPVIEQGTIRVLKFGRPALNIFNDTLKVNGYKLYTGSMTVNKGDIIKVYFNAGVTGLIPDSNNLKIAIDDVIIKEYHCLCVTNYSFIIN